LFIYRGQISAIVTFKEYEHIPFTKMPTNHGPLGINKTIAKTQTKCNILQVTTEIFMDHFISYILRLGRI